MEAGFVPDFNLGPEFWVPGPKPSSLILKRLVGYKVKIPITTYRCTACGYLESVAEG
jgi:lipopolysaccharide biosynthesis regulator YciM